MPQVISAGSGGPARDQLSTGTGNTSNPEAGTEVDLLQRALRQGFEDSREMDTRVLQDNYLQYESTIRYAAGVAKNQFDLDFGGIIADSDNEFVMDHINSAYFGYNDWSNMADVSADSTFTWIDEAVPDNLSGSADSPVTIGEPVVHLVMGIGSYETDPKTTRVQLEVNDTPKTVVTTDRFFRGTDLRLKWLDSPVLLTKDDELLVEGYAGEAGSEQLYFEGVTFVKNREARSLDPADLASGSSVDNEYPVSI